MLLYGAKGQVTVKYKNRYGRSRQYSTSYEGVIPFLQRRHSDSESDWSREQIETYMREVPCPACDGARLKPSSLAVTIGGREHLRGVRPVDRRVGRRSSPGWS